MILTSLFATTGVNPSGVDGAFYGNPLLLGKCLLVLVIIVPWVGGWGDARRGGGLGVLSRLQARCLALWGWRSSPARERLQARLACSAAARRCPLSHRCLNP